MSDVLKNEDKLGSVLVQVQDDLKQLKSSLEKISANEMGQTLDIKALDNAIRKTESTIKEHAENYLKTVNKQQLVLPNIEDLQKKRMQIPKWKPSLESITDVHSQREDLPGVSRGEKQKLALNMYLLHNLARPKNRANMHRKCGISLPVVHKRSTDAAKRHRLITGFVVSDQAREPKGCHIPAVPEEDMGTVPHPSSLHMSIQHKAASLHPREDLFSKIGSKSRCHKQPKWKTKPTFISGGIDKESTTKAPPPTATSKSLDQKNMEQDTDSLIPKSPENLPVHVPLNMTKYPFIIIKGQIDPLATDFCHFKRRFSLCWSSVVDPLEALTKLLRDFAVPVAKVSGEQLVELSHGWESGWKKTPTETTVLPVLENWEEVLDLVLHPGQRYKGEGGIEAAAIRIQSCWRRYSAELTYLCHCRRKWAAGTIAISWLMHTQMRRVRKALQARRFSQLEKNRSRAQHLAANWKHIQSSKRTIIHIPSLGYSQSQRRNLKGFDILQNIQISRVCDVRDGNVEVIYICPQHLEDDILLYYTNLLKCDGAADGADTSSCSRRFIILTPEAVGSFPTHNMCLSTLLKYSPRTLKRIRNLIQGKQAYIVGGVAHTDDLAVADELGVPILGSEPAVVQLYSTKSGGRRIFAGAEVDVPPGQGDIYSLNQLHETLAELMAQYIDVKRWLFKMDSEHGGRGTAYCDVNHLSCYNWALQEYHRYGAVVWNTKWIQEPVMLRYLVEIPEWLTHHARPAKISCYPNWACFLKTFLRQGGVVEACPPSDSVTCLTVALLLEPSGEVTMLSCGDQLHGSCQLGVLGATIPQTSIHPETLHSICIRVGQACLQRLIVGHISIDLATFLDHNTMDQKVWAVDLDIAYSDQLAMTQMLLMLTGGTLNCRAGCLEVPTPVREKCCEHQIEAKLIKKGPTVYHMCPVLIMFTNQTHKLNSDPEDMHEPPVGNRYAVIGIHLFHSNLSMLYRSVFFKICKAHGIVFNKEMKQGTVFALYESSEQCSIGMITVSEDLQGALVTFAQSLSVIHQEISSPKMPAETNFKGLIKEIEDVLQIIVKNKIQLQDKPAV